MALLFVVGAEGVCAISGLSADVKPSPTNLFTFYETDTGRNYLADGALWNLVLNSDYATEAQGATADSAVQPGSLSSAAYTISSIYATSSQGAKADTALQNAGAFATAAQGTKADTAIQAANISSAAYTLLTNYATSTQGATADTAVQPGSLSSAAYTLSSIYATSTQGNAVSSKAAITSLSSAAYMASTVFAAVATISSAAYTVSSIYATSSQGATADTAVQPGGISSAAYTLLTDYAISSHFHSADKITTSTFALARLGSGTTNISTFLSGASSFSQPSFSSLANMPTLGTAASTAAANYASSTHNITSATHTFPGGTVNFLREDGTFAAPPGGSSGPQLSSVRMTSLIFSTTTSTFALGPLGFTVSNTISYAFNFNVAFRTAISTTGIRIGATFPNVSTFGATVRIPIAAAGTGGEFQGWVTSTGGSVVGTAVQAASTTYIAEVIGTILPSANGTLQLTYATEVAGSAVSTLAGSYGILTTL